MPPLLCAVAPLSRSHSLPVTPAHSLLPLIESCQILSLHLNPPFHFLISCASLRARWPLLVFQHTSRLIQGANLFIFVAFCSAEMHFLCVCHTIFAHLWFARAGVGTEDTEVHLFRQEQLQGTSTNDQLHVLHGLLCGVYNCKKEGLSFWQKHGNMLH